ncbi:hypothetical protein [Haloplasma contractile]|uniref:Uncharacterized protein n=1 Tax=Haloplasma contractile SSD-17B TaxID=1033810 RepID=U2FMC9_9MOLU|nr:hypothetical protein [Haloplasma contractile]ERJ13875.1 hypothetical protein HLPCO_000541 [Haloplasma contractile SSD-17B]
MKKQVSGLLYLIPVLTMVFGITLFVTLLIKDIQSLVTIKDHHRILLSEYSLNEIHTVKFEDEGRYYLFIDHHFVNDVIVEQNNEESHILIRNEYRELELVQAFTIRMYKKSDELIKVNVHDMPKNQTITYTINNNEYTAVMYVEIEEAGEYEVVTQNQQEEYAPIDTILFRQFEFSSIVYGTLKYIGLVFLTIAVSITSFVIIFVKRRKIVQSDE